ncbi:MAG TPA: Smr/MutS family protein [Flavipsychrobacter sp.]|nr:Smr/MutS family protein [Flavipsychrobacter sp.]
MKFSAGDKIIIKRTGEEGIVTGFIGKDMLEVDVNGTQFPVYADEVDHPYLKWFTERNSQKKKAASLPEQLPVEKEKHRAKRLPKGIYLSFIPVFKANDLEDIVEQLKIYLINETPTNIRFGYEVKFFNQSDFQLEGALHAFGHVYLHGIDYGDMNDQPRFHWQLIDAGNSEHKTEDGVVRIKPSKLFEHINTLLLKNEPSFSYLLIEDFVLKPKENATKKLQPPQRLVNSARPPKITSFTELPRYELDLHAEQLISDYKKLSSAEIMNIQLQTLQRYLLLAIIHRQDRMVIIHGIGTGVLKDAVHKMLKEMADVKSFRNEYMGKYGFGATLVIFKL